MNDFLDRYNAMEDGDNTSITKKYHSAAARMYREKLEVLVSGGQWSAPPPPVRQRPAVHQTRKAPVSSRIANVRSMQSSKVESSWDDWGEDWGTVAAK